MFKALCRRIHPAVIVFGTLPVCFFGVLAGWGFIDGVLSRHEVTVFISEHRRIVDRRRTDSNVHLFNLSHDPEQFGRLLIRFDVEDKHTYSMLESDLDRRFDLRTPPRWETTVRSDERLGVDLGGVAQAIGMVFDGWSRICVAGILSVASFVAVFIFVTYSGIDEIQEQ